MNNRTVQKFTPSGAFIRNYGQPSQFTEIQGLAIDPDDNLYVCDFPGYRVTKFAQDGTQLSSWPSTRPIFAAADDFGNLYVTSSVGASITKYSYTASPEPPPPVEPGSIVISADNVYELYVNGKFVASVDEWRTPDTYAIDLEPGDNVVAVRGFDHCCNSGMGLIAEIHATDGAIHVTDASWKVSSEGPTGWTDPGCDDSEWASAFDEGPYNTIPWALFEAPLVEFSAHGARWIWRPTPPYIAGSGYYNPDGSCTNAYFRKTFFVDGMVGVERKSWKGIENDPPPAAHAPQTRSWSCPNTGWFLTSTLLNGTAPSLRST